MANLTNIEPEDNNLVAASKFARGIALKVIIVVSASFEFVVRAAALTIGGIPYCLNLISNKTFTDMTEATKSAANTITDSIAALATTHAASDPSTPAVLQTSSDYLKGAIAYMKKHPEYVVVGAALLASAIALYYYGQGTDTVLGGLSDIVKQGDKPDIADKVLQIINNDLPESPSTGLGMIALGLSGLNGGILVGGAYCLVAKPSLCCGSEKNEDIDLRAIKQEYRNAFLATHRERFLELHEDKINAEVKAYEDGVEQACLDGIQNSDERTTAFQAICIVKYGNNWEQKYEENWKKAFLSEFDKKLRSSFYRRYENEIVYHFLVYRENYKDALLNAYSDELETGLETLFQGLQEEMSESDAIHYMNQHRDDELNKVMEAIEIYAAIEDDSQLLKATEELADDYDKLHLSIVEKMKDHAINHRTASLENYQKTITSNIANVIATI